MERDTQQTAYYRLCAAIVMQAVKDSKESRGARKWLKSEDCAFYLDFLDIDRDVVLQFVETKKYKTTRITSRRAKVKTGETIEKPEKVRWTADKKTKQPVQVKPAGVRYEQARLFEF